MQTFNLEDKVSKTGGDYQFDGTVVSVFFKLSGVRRYVVEDDRGVLHIYSDKNLTVQQTQPSTNEGTKHAVPPNPT